MKQKYTITFTETTRDGEIRPSWKIKGANRAEAQQNAFNYIREQHDWDLGAPTRMNMQNFKDATEYIHRTSGGGLEMIHSPDDGMSQADIDFLAKMPLNQAYIEKDLRDNLENHIQSIRELKRIYKETLKNRGEAEQILYDYLREQEINKE